MYKSFHLLCSSRQSGGWSVYVEVAWVLVDLLLWTLGKEASSCLLPPLFGLETICQNSTWLSVGLCAELGMLEADSHKELMQNLVSSATIAALDWIVLAVETGMKTFDSNWALFWFLERADATAEQELRLVYHLHSQSFGDWFDELGISQCPCLWVCWFWAERCSNASSLNHFWSLH